MILCHLSICQVPVMFTHSSCKIFRCVMERMLAVNVSRPCRPWLSRLQFAAARAAFNEKHEVFFRLHQEIQVRHWTC